MHRRLPKIALRARLAIASALVVVFGAGSASAGPSDEILPPPPTYKGSGAVIVEKLGQRVPVDAKFRRADTGAIVTLGEVLAGDIPTILTFNYAACPMLCSLQLNGLTAALPGVSFRLGGQFRIVTVSLEPEETLERMTKMREHYLARLPEAQRADARGAWTFLVAATPGDASQIRRVADAVGFAYVYIRERAEWAHPAALIFLSTTGTVTRYVYGIEFPADVMHESIFKAGLAEPATAVGFMNRCYHYDPSANDHSRAGVMALRIGAAGFVVLLGVLGFVFLRRRSPENARGRAVPSEEAS
jgi:protein SCO1/2